MLGADDGEHRQRRSAGPGRRSARSRRSAAGGAGRGPPPVPRWRRRRPGRWGSGPPRARNDSAQGSPTTQRARSAVPTSVSGRPRRRARPGRRQAEARSLSPTRIPSVNRTLKSASSARTATAGSSGRSETAPSTPSPATTPARRKRTAVDRTLRSARSEIRTAARSVRAKTNRAVMRGASGGGGASGVPSRTLDRLAMASVGVLPIQRVLEPFLAAAVDRRRRDAGGPRGRPGRACGGRRRRSSRAAGASPTRRRGRPGGSGGTRRR